MHQTPHAYSLLIQAPCSCCLCKSSVRPHGFLSFLEGKATMGLDLRESWMPGCHIRCRLWSCKRLENVLTFWNDHLQAHLLPGKWEEHASALHLHRLVMPPTELFLPLVRVWGVATGSTCMHLQLCLCLLDVWANNCLKCKPKVTDKPRGDDLMAPNRPC